MTFYAGQDLDVAELEVAFPRVAFAGDDSSTISSTAFVDVDGLLVPLEADSVYAIDGWISYDSNAASDLKVQLLVPSGATGSWGLFALSTTSSGSVGTVQANRASVGAGNALTGGGSNSFSAEMNALFRGYVETAATAGDLQVQFAQNSSQASLTTVGAASWIRAQKRT